MSILTRELNGLILITQWTFPLGVQLVGFRKLCQILSILLLLRLRERLFAITNPAMWCLSA